MPRFHTGTWAADEQHTGDMWNSNSLISWVLARSGHDMITVHPPAGGRAPGWTAGRVAGSSRDQCRPGRFTAEAPNLRYVGEITYLPLADGNNLYLATVIDCYSRRLAGWAAALAGLEWRRRASVKGHGPFLDRGRLKVLALEVAGPLDDRLLRDGAGDDPMNRDEKRNRDAALPGLTVQLKLPTVWLPVGSAHVVTPGSRSGE